MNVLTQAYRTTCIPKANKLESIYIPNEYVGQEIEIIIYPAAKEPEQMDLSPIVLESIDWNDKKLRFKNSLTLTPKIDDSKQLYIIDYPELGLDVFAYTREELIEGINSDVAYLWEEYATTNDALTENAKALRNRLLEAIEEVG